jgi:hypothetical protein
MPITECRSIEVRSSQGRRFLRRVVAGKIPCRTVSSADHSWRLAYRIEDTGEEVLTDSRVTLTGENQGLITGFSAWEWDSPLIARLLLDGWRFSVHHSPGSVATRREGIEILSLRAFHPKTLTGVHPRYVTIGHITVLQHGKPILSGDVL